VQSYVLPALSLFLAVLFGLEPDWSQVAEHVPGTARGAAVPGTAGADKCPPRFKSSWSVPARLRLAEFVLDKGGEGVYYFTGSVRNFTHKHVLSAVRGTVVQRMAVSGRKALKEAK
jgi:hypothetical protein